MLHASMLLAAVVAAASPPDGRLTLSEAVAAAMQNFPAVAVSTEEARAARAVIDESRAARRPALTLGANATHYSDPALATPIHGFDFRNPPEFDTTLLQSALTASYSIYDAGARDARVEEATHLAESADAAIDVARQQAAARAAAAYATALGRAEIVAAHRTRISALDAELRRVRLLREVGRAPQVEIFRVEAALAAAEAERSDSAAALDAAERTLARITALPLDRTRAENLVPLSESSLALPAIAELESDADDAPLLRQARSRAAAQEATIDFARSGRRPQLTAQAQELFFATDDDYLTDEWNVALQLRFNVFDGGATKARIARATAASRAAAEQVRTAGVETGMALDRALAELQQSRAVVSSLAGAVEKFEEVARVEKLRLDNGAGTQTDYLRAEGDLVLARANLAAARYRAVAARVELARISGVLGPDWVEQTFGASE
jgi:outer membrane protein TolC